MRKLIKPKQFLGIKWERGLLAFYFIGMTSFLCFPISAYAIVTGFASALLNLQSQLGNIWVMLIGLTRVMAIVLGFIAIYKLKVYGRMTAFMSQNASILKPAAYLFVAAMFWNIHALLNVAIGTFWATDYDSIKSYELSSDQTWNALIEPVTLIIRIIGFVAFIRGWLLLLKSTKEGQQPGMLGKGFVHIIGGILGINILGTVDILRASFGF